MTEFNYKGMTEMNDSCKRLFDKMRERGLDAMLITDMTNVRYFSGFTGSDGYALIGKKTALVVTDSRYTEQAAIQAKGFEVKNIADFDIKSAIDPCVKVGFENLTVSYADYLRFSEKIGNLVPTDMMLTDIRSVKSDYEIECISRAAEIADAAFEHIVGYMRPGMTERGVAFEIEMFMRTHGADGLSFDTIVAAGEHGSMPHAEPSDRVIADGELVVMDYGCTYRGYCSDMTRTVAVGDVSDDKLAVYSLVKQVQSDCLAMIKPGAVCSDIHRYSWDTLNGAYPGCYGHGLGHGVGLEIHERPTLSTKCDVRLEPGHVVTVEPGLYIPGKCGVRIEDLVLVTKEGYRILSKSTKELVKIH